jgi:hypothetical protein
VACIEHLISAGDLSGYSPVLRPAASVTDSRRPAQHEVVGAVAVFAGLTLVQKVGVGTLNGLTICANLVASVAIDHFGLVGVPEHALSWPRLAGALLMVASVALVMRF